MDHGEPLVVEDLHFYPKSTILEERMLEHGYRSVYVAPLIHQDRLLGTLMLKSTRAGALNALNTPTPLSNFATRFGGTWNLCCEI
jgi:hypothetical protein